MMFEKDDWNLVRTWNFTNCKKKAHVHEGGGACGRGQGRYVLIRRDGETGEEISTYLIQHPNNQVYYRGKGKEMKLTGHKRILGSQKKWS